jgi:hypothetical protein
VTFRISKSDRSAQGADGMAFVCLLTRHGIDTALLGGDGAGLGYSGLGQAGDWAVEIDTYRRWVTNPALSKGRQPLTLAVCVLP